MVRIVVELALSKETPRRNIEQRQFPFLSNFIELSIFDLHFTINCTVSVTTPQDEIDFVDVEKTGIWIPSVFEELKLGISFPKHFIVPGPLPSFSC